jgi:hypothetical protein
MYKFNGRTGKPLYELEEIKLNYKCEWNGTDFSCAGSSNKNAINEKAPSGLRIGPTTKQPDNTKILKVDKVKANIGRWDSKAQKEKLLSFQIGQEVAAPYFSGEQRIVIIQFETDDKNIYAKDQSGILHDINKLKPYKLASRVKNDLGTRYSYK